MSDYSTPSPAGPILIGCSRLDALRLLTTERTDVKRLPGVAFKSLPLVALRYSGV